MEFYWPLCFWGAVGALAVTLVLAIFGRRLHIYKNPLRIAFYGVVVAAVVLFIPLYIVEYESGCPWETFLISIHNTIRLFVVDGDFAFVVDNALPIAGEALAGPYSVLMAFLFVLAPVLTFSVALTFINNLAAYEQYVFNFFAETYVFSEINEKSLSLAKSLHKENPRCLLVFTDVFDDEEERSYELQERAKKLGAICFKSDITSRVFTRHSRHRKLCFFTVGEDFTENTRQALSLIETFREWEKAELYVSSTLVETELLLAGAVADKEGVGETKMRVRRIHEVRSLVNYILYEDGYKALFESAVGEKGNKRITAVVVGMGAHGTAMTKALAWCGQMDGYSLSIHAFDRQPMAEEKFRLLCPELTGSFHYDRAQMKGTEPPYDIHVHSGIEVDTAAFVDMVAALHPTYIFVSLGNDELNIAQAVCLRELCQRQGDDPYIQAIVYNSEKKRALEGLALEGLTIKVDDQRVKQYYHIDFVGDLDTTYSKRILINSNLEQAALERHKKWGAEKDFWLCSYNYQSSTASAIHARLKKQCEIPGILLSKEERAQHEEWLWAIRRLEHRRWNAYMRSEGYIYRADRDNLAKTHPCILPFDDLPLEEQEKDDD